MDEHGALSGSDFAGVDRGGEAGEGLGGVDGIEDEAFAASCVVMKTSLPVV